MYKTTVFLMCFVQKPEQFFCAIGCRIHRMIKRYWIFAVILWLKAQHNCWLRCKVEIFNDDINHCNRDLMCIQALWFNMSKIFVHLIHVKYMWCSQWWHVVRSKCVFILFFGQKLFHPWQLSKESVIVLGENVAVTPISMDFAVRVSHVCMHWANGMKSSYILNESHTNVYNFQVIFRFYFQKLRYF